MASDKPKKLTRRDFLKLSGAASLGLALSACGLAPTSTVTPAPTNTPLLTATFTPTLSPTSTNTPAPASTPTATPTPRPPTFRELADMAGIEIVTYCFWQKLLDSNYTKSYLTIANKMRIGYELENSQIYNAYFDWQRVLGEWERVRKELSEGSIPFEQEVFDPLYISRTEMLISFARKNNLSLIGSGMLFWSGGTPDILKINLSPEEKRKILEFMVKAKVMRFRDVGEWAGVSELSACEL